MAKAPTTPNPSASGDKIKSLDTVMAQIEKAHGKGSIMRLGEDVRHPKFGEGVILDLEGEGDKTVAVVRFRDGEKRLLLSWAPLEKV